MHADLTLLTQRLGNAVGGYKVAATTTVADLAHAVDVVDAGMPVARLELIFRSPHVASVAVRDPDDDRRIGLVTRTRFTAAMTGRLGFGRAVLARRGTDELTDWGPMVVPPTAPVSEVAVRAMQRFDERRYDNVLVADESWGVVSTADLVRSLSTLLAVRSLHDPLTALPHRSMAMHSSPGGAPRAPAPVRAWSSSCSTSRGSPGSTRRTARRSATSSSRGSAPGWPAGCRGDARPHGRRATSSR